MNRAKVLHCLVCGTPIKEGEFYVQIKGTVVCERCLNKLGYEQRTEEWE